MISLNNKTGQYNLDEIKLELSYLCHMQCLHCSSEGSPDKITSISLEDVLSIIESANLLNVKTISLSGGEPFLWPYLKELIDFCKTKELNIKLYTSGSTDNFETIISTFNNLPIEIIFSLYSSKSALHDDITGVKGSFHRTKASIQYTMKKGISSEIHFVPLSINCNELIPIAKFATEFGIKKISVLRFVSQGRGANKTYFILNKNENIELKEDILALRKFGFNIRTGSPLNFLLLKDQPKCTSGVNKLVIAPDLSIYPCDAFKQIRSEELFGHDEFSSLVNHCLEDCWSKSKYLNVVREILKSGFQEPCNSCSKLNLCNSGCLAQKVIISNSLKKTCDPSCLLYRDIKGMRKVYARY